jgi:hypothetical protein
MIIIDYNAIAISNIVVNKMDIEENMIRHMILNSIRMHRTKHHRQYGELVIANDGQKNWRYDAFPNYKAKRQSTRKESSIDWPEAFRIINKIYEELGEHFPYKTIKVDECEADDVVGQLVEYTQTFGNHEPVMIISGDKDFAQLQKYDNVAQYSPVQKKMIKELNPRKQKLELILKGDTSDGVPNVLSPDNCFVDEIRQTPLRQKVIDQLMVDPKALGDEVYRNYLRNKKLIDLDETPDHIKLEIINRFEQQGDKTENKGKVFNYLVANQCRLLLEVVGDFI